MDHDVQCASSHSRICRYPFGKLSDRVSHGKLLAAGLVVLIASDLVLASASSWVGLGLGVALWGVHMGMTQGLLAAMVADTAPEDLRGTAYVSVRRTHLESCGRKVKDRVHVGIGGHDGKRQGGDSPAV